MPTLDLFGPDEVVPPGQRHYLKMTISARGVDSELICRHEPLGERYACHAEFFLEDGLFEFWEQFTPRDEDTEVDFSLQDGEIYTWTEGGGYDYEGVPNDVIPHWRYLTKEEFHNETHDCSGPGKHRGPWTQVAPWSDVNRCEACGTEIGK